jgi:hypothetical protein
VPARLEPAIELAVMEQENAFTGFRDRDRAPGEMPFRDGPVEGTRIPADEVGDPPEVSRFGLVRRLVARQDGGEGHGRLF